MKLCECKGKNNDCPKCFGLGYIEPNVRVPGARRFLGEIIRDSNSSFYGISSGCSRTIPIKPRD